MQHGKIQKLILPIASEVLFVKFENDFDFSPQLYNQYIVKYTDTTDLFINVIKNIKVSSFKIFSILSSLLFGYFYFNIP
jgi:hypothetical protein